MESEYPKLYGFLTHDIARFVVPDLQRLRHEIRPDPNGLRGCTVATTMFAFAILDLLGFLMRPVPDPKREETTKKSHVTGSANAKQRSRLCRMRKKTKKNIRFTLSGDAGLFPNEYGANCEILIELFRHDLTHQVFPKAAGIAKASPCTQPSSSSSSSSPSGSAAGIAKMVPPAQVPLVFYEPGGTPILNAGKLVDDLLTALEELPCMLELGAHRGLATRMEERIGFLQETDGSQLLKMRKKGLVNL